MPFHQDLTPALPDQPHRLCRPFPGAGGVLEGEAVKGNSRLLSYLPHLIGGPVTITSPKNRCPKPVYTLPALPVQAPGQNENCRGASFRLAFSSANPIMHTPSAENDGFLIQDPFGACHQGSHSLVARVDRDGRDKAHPLGQLGLEGRQAHQLAA